MMKDKIQTRFKKHKMFNEQNKLRLSTDEKAMKQRVEHTDTWQRNWGI